MRCPHCLTTLQPHMGTRDGFAHCNACGCCFAPDGSGRAGHPVCGMATAIIHREQPQEAGDEQVIDGTDAEPAAEEPRPARPRRRK